MTNDMTRAVIGGAIEAHRDGIRRYVHELPE
jgi:hypothetical protein